MGWRNDQCRKVCRIIDDSLANRPTERDSLIVAVQKAFNALERQRWIPVSKRLPEEKDEYLVTYHPCYWDDVEDEIKVGIDSFRGKTAWAKKKYQRVIAWIPLPEPYQGVER